MIRRARLGDVEALAALNERTVWATYGAHVDHAKVAAAAEWMPDRWREGLAGEARLGRETWVLERDGTIGGWVTLGRSRDADATADVGELWSIYVEPDRIGAGDGGALERHATARLRELGFRAATLWVMAYNERARAFYARRGWVTDPRPAENPWASWGEAVRLRRDLAAGPGEEEPRR